MMFNRGDRVRCPGGFGTVMYKRMAAPAYNEVAAYSIRLDNVNYSYRQYLDDDGSNFGTIYPAEEVHSIEE